MFVQQESGPVMDQLAASLLPEDFPSTKPSDTKPKVTACLLDTLLTYMNTQERVYQSYTHSQTMGRQ